MRIRTAPSNVSSRPSNSTPRSGSAGTGVTSLSSMVRVSGSAVSAGLVLSASMTMVSPSSSSASSVTVIVTVPAVSPAARVIVVEDNV